MSKIFNLGNAPLNGLMNELLELESTDHVLEIGFGTGKFMRDLAKQTKDGMVEGIDFSRTMYDMARRNNRKAITRGKVKIALGDFDQMDYKDNEFDKVCSANTIYFWPDPEVTIKKIHRIMKPEGGLVIGFGDKARLEKRQLDRSLFRVFSQNEVKQLLGEAGFSAIEIKTLEMDTETVHCAVATK